MKNNNVEEQYEALAKDMFLECSRNQVINGKFEFQPERSKREDLKKCIICECKRPIKEVPNKVCNDCSEDSTFADQF